MMRGKSRNGAMVFFVWNILKLLEVGDVRSNLESAQPEEVGLDT